MAKKSREQELMRRLRAAGITNRSGQAGAPLKFLVVPKVTKGVDIRKLAIQFRDEVYSKIRTCRLSSPITSIVIFPTILDPELSSDPDKVTFKRAEKALFVAVPFREWDAASPETRIDLLAANILESVRRIPSKYLLDPDRHILNGTINEVREKLKGRLLH